MDSMGTRKKKKKAELACRLRTRIPCVSHLGWNLYKNSFCLFDLLEGCWGKTNQVETPHQSP